jgi:hypothetical protein
MEGSVERTRDDDAADETYEQERRRSIADDLILMARFALMDSDGHPVTHICGVPIEDVRRKAESYAKGINMGSDLGRRFPW